MAGCWTCGHPRIDGSVDAGGAAPGRGKSGRPGAGTAAKSIRHMAVAGLSTVLAAVSPAVLVGGLTATLLTSTALTPAFAQDYTTGELVGTVKDRAGNPVAGIVVTLTDEKTGFQATSTTGKDGVFRFPRLRIATYTASVKTSSGELKEKVRVQAGTVRTLTFTIATGKEAGAQLEEIRVIGQAVSLTRKDPLGQEGGIVVDVDDLVARIPVPRNITDVALLAPGVARGDSAFGNLPSIAGSSVAENTIYVNGYNITDLRRFLGPMNRIPFEFFQQVDVKSGGFQAEFGRATGGVTNLVTRRGGNEFHAGANLFYTPDGLRSHDTPDTTDIFRSMDRETDLEVNTWLSGPIIKDRLFFYGLVSFRDRQLDDFRNSDVFFRKDDDPVWGINIDGVLWDDDVVGYHTVTYTHIDDQRQITDEFFNFDRDTKVVGDKIGTTTRNRGGTTDIVKYTGVVRDWLTLSGLFGNSKARFDDQSDVSDNPAIFDLRSGTVIRRGNFTDQIVTPVDNDERTLWRADVDIYVNDFFGDHKFRLGFDRERRQSAEESAFSGGVRYVYFANGSSLDRFDPTGKYDNVEVARVDKRTTGGTFTSIFRAFYVQDQWQTPIDRLTLNIGARFESDENKNVNGERFVKFSNVFDYRTGFTYFTTDDESSRIYGFAGRYHLPVPQNTNVRLAGEEVFTESFFELLGLNPDETPILGEFIGTDEVSPGGVQDARTLVAQNLSEQRMQEFILGYDQAYGEHWTFGVRAVYRDLKNGLEDGAIDRGMINFAIDNGLDVDAMKAAFGGFSQFILMNPGRGVTFFTDAAGLPADALAFLGGDPDGDGLVQVSLTADQLGLPKIKRRYRALEFTADREFADGWSVQASYVLSRLTGNTEGGVKSDIGQTDTGLTQDFDTKGLTDGTTGRLPNDHLHTLKVFGSYQLTKQLTFGANFMLQSPRHFGCLGVHPTDEIAAQFGASSFFCKLDANNRPSESAPSRPTPRGSVLRSDWTKQLDLSLRIDPQVDILGGAHPSFRIDVFNIFDTHDVTDRNEFGEFGSGAIRPTFGDPTGFIQPRMVRLSARLEF